MALPRVASADLSALIAAVQAVLKEPHRLSVNGDVTTRGTGYDVFVGELWRLLGPYLVEPPRLVQRFPSIRVKDGRVTGGRYETSIVHTDAWSGNLSSVVMIPIEGDFERGGVEFYLPTRNLGRLLDEYPDYADVPDFGAIPVGRMEPGKIYFLDAACLHKTMLGGRRVSVDVRLVYGDVEFSRRRNYVEYRK